jgi:hypothetical protein
VVSDDRRPGHPTGHSGGRMKQEIPMLKIFSAALIATSILAAPAMAATVIKTERAPVTKTIVVKPSVAKAHAQVVVVKKHRHHRRPVVHTHRHGHGHKVVIVKKHRHF